jgi:hypothetical protein
LAEFLNETDEEGVSQGLKPTSWREEMSGLKPEPILEATEEATANKYKAGSLRE